MNKQLVVDAQRAKAVNLIEKGHLGGCSPEKDCCCQVRFWQRVQKRSSESSDS